MRYVLWALLLCPLAYANSAGQTFAYQNQGFSQIQLFNHTNPVLAPTWRNFSNTGIANLDFVTWINGCSCLTTWIFHITINGLGTFTSSQSAMLGSGLNGFGAGIALPLNFGYHPAQGALSFTVNGQMSGPYLFQYLRPVPEPSSLLLVGSGLLFVGRKLWTRL